MMKLTQFIIFGLCLALALADKKCQDATGDLKLKQSLIQKIVDHVNRPYLPDTEAPTYDSPKMKYLGKLPKTEVFSLFDERQWPEAEFVLKLMMKATDFDEFLRVSDAIRHRVNNDLFLYTFSVAITHRPDTKGLMPPRVQDVYPDKFFTHDVIVKIREAANRGEKNIVVNDTHDYWNNLDLHHRLSYFTEDLGLNSHHYHWHVMNPALWSSKLGEVKERRAELFAWTHKEMLARYDSERMSMDLPRTRPFEDWDHPIHTGYAPHLTIDRTGYIYSFRPDDMVLKNLPELTKHQLRLWRGRILDSIHKHYVYARNGTKISIREEPEGTDIVASLVESSRESINRPYYGNLHSYAHVIAGQIADPDGKYEQDHGVMYDVAVSARDPLFYKWHKFINNIFREYKETKTGYTPAEVTWSGIDIESVKVQGEKTTSVPNKITTFWDHSTFKLGKHYTFTGQSTAEINVQHLQHEDFSYDIELVNNAGGEKNALVRIFLAPKYDEQHKPLKPNDQRSLAIMLDQYIAKIKPGKNTLHRHSSESTVTVPDKYIFAPADTLDYKEQTCRCGWPNYLLVPRGKPEGMTFKLIVYISNYDEEKTDYDKSCYCHGSGSYCGIVAGKLGVKTPLGYPLDRKIDSLKWKEIQVPNLYTSDVIIKFVGDNLTPTS